MGQKRKKRWIPLLKKELVENSKNEVRKHNFFKIRECQQATRSTTILNRQKSHLYQGSFIASSVAYKKTQYS